MPEEIRKQNKMGIMPVGPLILSMSWPAMVSMTVVALYNVVDSLFIAHMGNGLGEKGLTAITLVFPINMLMIALGVGTGVGINSMIARKLGERRQDQADMAASNGFKLAFINWAVFIVIGIFASKPFIGLFTDDPTIYDMGVRYMTIICVGAVFIMVQMITEKIIQGTGNMIIPMITGMIGAGMNIVLDPILIFGYFGCPKLGIAGAAIATVLGQLCGMTAVLLLMFKRKHLVRIDLKSRFDRETIKEIYVVGGPVIVMQAVVSILTLGMNAILASFSSTAVAIVGVYGRLQSFIFMPVFGLNQGCTPVFGFNYGARDKKRLMSAYKFGLLIAIIIMGAGMIIFQTMPDKLLSWFDASPEMMKEGVHAFHAISICFLPAAFGIITSTLMSAIRHAFMSLWGSLIRQLIGILPLAVLFAHIGGLRMVWWAYPAAEILAVAFYIIALQSIYKKDISKLGNPITGPGPISENK